MVRARNITLAEQQEIFRQIMMRKLEERGITLPASVPNAVVLEAVEEMERLQIPIGEEFGQWLESLKLEAPHRSAPPTPRCSGQ